MALYVSNPRRRGSAKRRHSSGGDARAAMMAADVARILEGKPPMSSSERSLATAQAKLIALEKSVGTRRTMERLVEQSRDQALGLAAREVALKRALREVGGGSGKSRKANKSRRRAKKGGWIGWKKSSVRARNPFDDFAEIENPRRRRRKGSKSRRRAAPRRASRGARRNAKGRFVKGHGRKGGARRRNGLSISNPMSGIPVLGTAVGLLGPVMFAALGVEAIGQVCKFAVPYLPVSVSEKIAPVQYTIGGLLLAGLVQLVTPIPAPVRHSLGVGLASAGGAVDWYRYRSASGAYGALELGDGGAWAVEYGDGEAFGALELSGIDFSGDEDYCGADFSMAEGEAACDGYGAYTRRFPVKRQGRHVPAHAQHDPRKEGDRFHWLAKLVGPEDFKRIANMSPNARVEMIARCKAACRGAMAANGPALPRQIAMDDHMERMQPLPRPEPLSVPFVQDNFPI